MKTWQKVLLTLIVLFLVAVFLIFVGIYQSLTAPPHIADNSVLYQPVEELVEWRATDVLSRTLSGNPPTLLDIVENLRKAAVDKRVQAVVLMPTGSSYGWAKATQLRRAVQEYRSSGKPIFSFIERAGNLQYYLASAATKVYMVPSGNLMLNGLASQAVFLRGTLEKLGVFPDLEHIGKYKTASDVFTRKDMSSAQREMVGSILDSYFSQYVDTLATARDVDPGGISEIIDTNLFLTSEQALEYGLVDSLLYLDQVDELLKKQNGGTLERLSSDTYRKIPARTLGLDRGPKIALVYAVGSIVLGSDAFDPLFGSAMGSSRVVQDIRSAAEDESIKAIVFRVDSPGGDALASDIIWRATQVARQKKPFIVSMSDMAGSGGYYIAMGADSIVAEPGTLTGSIGVITGKFSLEGLYGKIGMNIDIIKRGRFADAMTDSRPFTPDERQRVVDSMWETYRTFATKAAEGRGMTYAQIDSIGRGRVWTGAQAVNIGLVDVLGGLDTAINIAKEKAGIPLEQKVRLVLYPKEKSLLEMILTERLAGVHFGSDLSSLQPVLAFFRAGRLYRDFAMLTLMPWWLLVK